MAVHKVDGGSGYRHGGVAVKTGEKTSLYAPPGAASDAAADPGADRFLAGPWAADRPVEPAASGDAVWAAAGANAAIHLHPEPDRQHVLFGVAWGYDVTPASGALVRVESPSGVPVFEQPVTQAGADEVVFPKALRGTEGGDMVVLLTGGNAPKRLSLLGRRTE